MAALACAFMLRSGLKGRNANSVFFSFLRLPESGKKLSLSANMKKKGRMPVLNFLIVLAVVPYTDAYIT